MHFAAAACSIARERVIAWISRSVCKWRCCQAPSMLNLSVVHARLQMWLWRAATFLLLVAVLSQVIDNHMYFTMNVSLETCQPRMLEMSHPSDTFSCCSTQTSGLLTSSSGRATTP